MRILGIDFGLKRIGVAISNSFLSFALPLGRIERQKDENKTLTALKLLLKEYKDIEKAVIGLPLHLSGKESEMSLEARKFGTFLEQNLKIPVEFIDERLTSKNAEALLREGEMNRKSRDSVVDSVAATLILQSYLELISLRG
jgi:putative Holliday junction resolvase